MKTIEEMKKIYSEDKITAKAYMKRMILDGEFDSDVEIDEFWGRVIERDFGSYRHEA